MSDHSFELLVPNILNVSVKAGAISFHWSVICRTTYIYPIRLYQLVIHVRFSIFIS